MFAYRASLYGMFYFTLFSFRAAHPNSPVELLIEVEAITSVIGRASNREVFGGAVSVEPTALQASAAAAQRVRWLMLALLARFHRPAADLPDQNNSNLLYYKVSTSHVTTHFILISVTL